MNELSDIQNQALALALAVLEDGGTILYPTDTVWGIGCNATNKEAVLKVFTLKERDATKSFILLVASIEMLALYVGTIPVEVRELLASTTEPLTIIYPKAERIPLAVCHSDGSVAIRVTTDPFCKALITSLGVPLVSTSANLSGAPTPTTFGAIDPRIVAGVEYVVPLRQEECTSSKPSRIISIDVEGNITVVRE
ncbi:MAG: L-threonylcarbamoyladenylate synthase [Candidatus Pacebacteria bacterium]|jgi:L-threonylcarbamoyladenylate synthase|nr:L-threonylcarbamoyladenylate synthase [Candidatus Paceibacterota bacterium]